MDVEVDDRDACEAVHGERVRRADGDVVEDAEAHRATALGMVSGRPDRAERRSVFAAADQVDGDDDRAGRMQRRRHRMRVQRGIGIEDSAVRWPGGSASIAST